jgi:hypothetical protein
MTLTSTPQAGGDFAGNSDENYWGTAQPGGPAPPFYAVSGCHCLSCAPHTLGICTGI